jgi:hypothetical protein
MVESIEVIFFPGSVSTANTYTVASPVTFNTTPAAAVAAQLADVNVFYQSGMLVFNILSKNYLRETPMIAFPPKTNFNLDVAFSGSGTAENGAVNGRVAGRPYYISPEIALQPAVNFGINLLYPSAVATPSGFNARVGVILDGYFMRASQ